jgi:hypothetical protein
MRTEGQSAPPAMSHPNVASSGHLAFHALQDGRCLARTGAESKPWLAEASVLHLQVSSGKAWAKFAKSA